MGLCAELPLKSRLVPIAELKVYANTLYAGDILAGEAACVITPYYAPSPPSQGGSNSSQKIQQQRALAAQVKCFHVGGQATG
jgi:hypothetical protein